MGDPTGSAIRLAESGSSNFHLPQPSEVYAQFSALIAIAKLHFQSQLGGKLLLYGQLNAQGAALALAANIAGAASLGVDSDADRLRQGIRNGACDFVVNSLDEALRILKNEIRKKQPVAVCLEGDLAATLQEAVERGLQPDLLAFPGATTDLQTLIQRGSVEPAAQLTLDSEWLDVTWTAESAPAKWLPKVDSLAAQVLPAGDDRARWLKLAPRYLGRSLAAKRYLQMTVNEAETFTNLVDEAVTSSAIGTNITVTRQKPIPRQPR